MKKTLLLVFIHGFQGDDDTFKKFPEHLRALLSHALPKLKVVAIIYPKFETRGDLRNCVSRFREWLENKVIDLEVENGTPSPTVDPSVHTVLVGHSMGGIVGAETIISILSDQPIPGLSSLSGDASGANSGTATPNTTTTVANTTSNANPTKPTLSRNPSGTFTPQTTLMFPYINGLLAFDTPYLGLNPGIVAHGAEGQWNHLNNAYGAFTTAANLFGWGAANESSNAREQANSSANAASKLLPAPGGKSAAKEMEDVAVQPSWAKVGQYALFAGAAGAVAAGGVAAYANRKNLSEGFTWAGSHLEFVGCLARGDELQQRLAKVNTLAKQKRIGFLDIYTNLGKAAQKETEANKLAAGTVGKERTFCVVPKNEQLRVYWWKATNDKATSEVWAHTSMFMPTEHPGYYGMGEKAKGTIRKWVEGTEWYQSATGPEFKLHPGAADVDGASSDGKSDSEWDKVEKQ